MGKRQTRIFANEILATKTQLQGQEVCVVFKSGKTVAGVWKSSQNNRVLLTDHFLQKHYVDIEEIEEIVIDFVATH